MVYIALCVNIHLYMYMCTCTCNTTNKENLIIKDMSLVAYYDKIKEMKNFRHRIISVYIVHVNFHRCDLAMKIKLAKGDSKLAVTHDEYISFTPTKHTFIENADVSTTILQSSSKSSLLCSDEDYNIVVETSTFSVKVFLVGVKEIIYIII